MEQDFLKYGDLVTLFGSIPSSIQSPVRRSRRNPFQAFVSTGFLSAIGFTDERVFLQTVPNPLADPLSAVGDLINQRDLVFQVWPKLSCEAHKQMRKLKKERDLLNGDSDDEEKEATEEAFIKLSNRIKEEKKANQKILEYALNNPVVYGSEVQFMHVSSKSYLKADISCSESDKSAYKFELSDEYSSKMVFKISPKYNVRQEGEPVQFGDQVLIYSSKLDCYVNFSMSNPIDMDKEIPPIDDVPPITRPFDYRKLDEGSQRYEAHISQFRDCLWKIYHYSSYKSEEESMIVRGGDLVRIRHTEHEAYLAADYCMQTENPEVYGRLYYGEFSEESESINSIWEVEIDNRSNKGGNCEILGSKKNYKHIRLRHLLTGRILETGPMEVGHEVWRIPMLVKSQFMRNTYPIIFHGFANNPKKELYYNTAYSMGFRIENDEGSPKTVAESASDEPEEFHRYVTVHAHKDFSTLDMTNCSPKSSLSASPKHLGLDHVKMFRPLREGEFSTKKKLFIVEALEPSAEHAFLLQKVDFEKTTDIAFVASSITHLIHFRDLIMSKPEFDQINWDEMPKTLSVLKKLIFFVNNVNSKTQENYDPATYEGMVVQSRQKLLKDFRMIEILTEILYYPFQLNMFTLNNIHNQTFKTIFQYCYRLIKHIIKEYRPNEIYASQWLEFFMGQAMGSDEKNDIKAEATLTELIDNNKKILDSKIDKDIISKFVYMLKDNKKEKFVHLLQALIVCDGNAVLKNQTEASTLIFEDEEISKTLIVPFRIKGDEIEMYVEDYSPEEEDCWMPIIEFYHLSQENDDGDNFRYLEGLIHLFSNLCLERNYIAIDHLESVYTYDLCFKVVASTREELIGLRSAFLRLMNTLWLDRKPYQPMNLPRYVILMEELYPRSLDQIMSSDNKTKRFDGLKGYLQRYFAELAEVGCTKIYQTKNNSFTSLALDVTLTLARFGFYNTLKELENLVRPLLVLLNGMRDATNALEFKEFQRELKKFRTEVDARAKGRVKTLYNQIKTADLLDIGIEKKMIERHKESEETLIVMECKEKICHLLKIIMQISEDMCVRRFLHEYKKRVDPPRQVSPFTLSPSMSTERNPSSREPLKSSSPLRGSSRKYSQVEQKSEGHEGEEVIVDQAQLIAKIAEENQLDFAKLAPTNFSKILFDLLHYDHEDLIHQVFELLYMSHSKQLRLKNVIEHVRVIENFERREAIIAIEEKVKKLIELAETSENWYSLRRPRGSKNEYEQCVLLIKELEYYLMYDDSNVKARHDSEEIQLDVLGLEEAMEMMSKDSESQLDLGSTNAISYEFQQILRHLKAHEPLLSLLKFEISTPPEIRNETKTKLLSEIMRFLARFVYREKVNQELLTDDTRLLFKLMKKHPDIGVEDVLECLFRDNKKLIQQEDDVDQFARRIIKLFNAGKDYKNSRLLQALIVLMSYKGKPLKLNQVAITSLLTSRENSEKFFSFMMKENKEEFMENLQKYDDEVQKGSTTGVLIELPYDIDYATSLIHVMASASEGKCAITESKTQAIFPIVDLIAMYENAKRCWHIKYALLLLFTHAYMDTERERKDTANHLGKFLDLMIADMEYILDSEDNYEIVYHKGRIKSNLIQEFVLYRGFLPCFDELLTKRIHKSIPSLNDKLVKVLRIVIATRGNTINQVYLKKMRSCIERFKVYAKAIYYKAMNKPYKQADTPLNLSMDVMEDDDVFKEKFTIAVRDPNKNANELKKFVSKLNQRVEFQKNVAAEFERLVNSLVNVDRFQENNFYSAPISFDEVTKSLINLVDIKTNILDKSQMLIGLKIFRRVIERENKLHPNTPAAQWSTSMWINSERKIVRRQNDLCRLGLVELLCNMISHCNDIELQFESMLLGIALLLGGNKAVQDEFLKYIQEDIQNNFLISIKETIVNSFEVIKKTMSERNKYYWKKAYVVTDREKLNRNFAPRKGKSMDTVDERYLDDIISSNTQENDEAFYEEIGLSLTLLERVYRFLQLLCEGHNFELQSQLRVQKTFTGSINRRTFDFISHTAYYFNALTKQINIDSLDVGIQILDFLIEAVQGPCEDNQRALAKSNIINSSMDFLTVFRKRSDYMKRGFFTQEQVSLMDQAAAKSMKLLNAMIEGSSSSNTDILEGMGSLDFSFLIQKLASYYSHLVREKLNMNPETASPQEVTMRLPKDAFDQKVLESFDVYILLSTLADHSEKVAFLLENTDEYTDLEQRALEFFRLNTVHIEITFKEKLLKAYFPVYPACRQLSKNTRSEFLQEVNRESPNEKIMGLLQAAPILFDEMEHLAYLGSKAFKFTMKRYNTLRDLSNIISLVINVIIVSTEYLSIKHDNSVQEINDIGKLSTPILINILGWIQICTSALMIIFWLRVNSPMIFREKWREEVKWKSLTPEQEQKLAYMLEDRDLSEIPPSVGLEILWKKGPYNPYFFMTGKRDFGHFFVHASYYYKNVIFICRNGKFLFMMFYLVVSILGTALSEITYSLHLLDVINRFKTLRNVVRSVTGNIKQLFLTAILGLILIYIYAIIGYNFFDSQYYSPDVGESGERFCNTMLQCYLSTLNLGLRSGGGIGDMLMLPSFQPDVRMNYYFRVIFDLTFFLLINIIFLNIIFGIIVDTFADMRDQKKAMDEDVKNKCYICNLDRNIFDKSGPGFEKHIKNDHLLWNYLFFIYSIKAKDPTEFTGIESYVQEKLKEEDISWFPMFKALEIDGGETQEVE